jgi:hypothetical protein
VPGWQRPQRASLFLESLLDQEATAGVPASVPDLVAPVGVLRIELAQAVEPACRPEAAVQVADRRFDRSFLPRCRRRAGGGVEGVMAAQVQEAAIPDHLVALAAGDD